MPGPAPRPARSIADKARGASKATFTSVIFVRDLRGRARMTPHRTSIKRDGAAITYGQLTERVNRAAQALLGLGVQPAELSYMLADSGASVLVWAPELADSVAGLGELPGVGHRITLGAGSAAADSSYEELLSQASWEQCADVLHRGVEHGAADFPQGRENRR